MTALWAIWLWPAGILAAGLLGGLKAYSRRWLEAWRATRHDRCFGCGHCRHDHWPQPRWTSSTCLRLCSCRRFEGKPNLPRARALR